MPDIWLTILKHAVSPVVLYNSSIPSRDLLESMAWLARRETVEPMASPATVEPQDSLGVPEDQAVRDPRDSVEAV